MTMMHDNDDNDDNDVLVMWILQLVIPSGV